MVDLHSILLEHRSKVRPDHSHGKDNKGKSVSATSCEIPDLFFDRVVVEFKLNRIEIIVLMFLYRKVWCYPNLHRDYGISPMISHTEMAKALGLTIEETYSALRKIEEHEFIKTIRSGQYFVRRYFSKEYDETFGQSYSDFDE